MKLLLMGVCGYGSGYVKYLTREENRDLTLEGIVEPHMENCPVRDLIEENHIPVYDTMEDFYQEHQADLALIVTPTFLHREHTLCALQHGSYVLCEKPAAPVTEDVLAMQEAGEQAGKWVGIAFQWSYSEAMQALKKDILEGKLGKPLSMKTLICWPRNHAYYARGGGWGGSIRKNGKLVLDSIASNACAHYLHNMLFVLGDEMNTAAKIQKVESQCLRANNIENFDTCVIRLETESGAQLYFAATHACEKQKNPCFEYRFEKAVVIFDQEAGCRIVARFEDGTEKDYGNPFASEHGKVRNCAKAIETGREPVCTAKTALPHVQVIEEIYKNGEIRNFPAEETVDDGERVYVKNLFEKIQQAYEREDWLEVSGK